MTFVPPPGFETPPVTPPVQAQKGALPVSPSDEPVMLDAIVKAGIAAVASVLIAFGWWKPTTDQMQAITGLVMFVTLVTGLLVRRQVTPVSKLTQRHP